MVCVSFIYILFVFVYRSFNTTSLFCDCQLSWSPIWLRDNNFEHSVIAKCAHPSNLKGKSIFVVDSSEYKCGMYLELAADYYCPQSYQICKV